MSLLVPLNRLPFVIPNRFSGEESAKQAAEKVEVESSLAMTIHRQS